MSTSEFERHAQAGQRSLGLDGTDYETLGGKHLHSAKETDIIANARPLATVGDDNAAIIWGEEQGSERGRDMFIDSN